MRKFSIKYIIAILIIVTASIFMHIYNYNNINNLSEKITYIEKDYKIDIAIEKLKRLKLMMLVVNDTLSYSSHIDSIKTIIEKRKNNGN